MAKKDTIKVHSMTFFGRPTILIMSIHLATKVTVSTIDPEKPVKKKLMDHDR